MFEASIIVGQDVWLFQVRAIKTVGTILALFAFALVFSAPQSRAQSGGDDTSLQARPGGDKREALAFDGEREDEDEGEREDEEKSDWSFSLGAVVGIGPDYEGSDDYDLGYGPHVRIGWRKTVVVTEKSVRVFVLKDKTRMGLVLAADRGRDDDDDLQGLGEIDFGAEAGLFASHKIGMVTLKTEARKEFIGGHGGLLADFGAEIRVPLGEKPWLKAEVETTWADGGYSETFFGVNATQSTNSGLRQFDADAGFKNISVAITTGYNITNHWVVGAMVGYSRMLGDAADSPIVKDVGSRNQFSAGIGLSYKF